MFGLAALVRSDHADPNRFPLSFWMFQTCLLRLFFVLEGLRQRRKLPIDVLEEQPLLDYFWHQQIYSTGFPDLRNMTA